MPNSEPITPEKLREAARGVEAKTVHYGGPPVLLHIVNEVVPKLDAAADEIEVLQETLLIATQDILDILSGSPRSDAAVDAIRRANARAELEAANPQTGD